MFGEFFKILQNVVNILFEISFVRKPSNRRFKVLKSSSSLQSTTFKTKTDKTNAMLSFHNLCQDQPLLVRFNPLHILRHPVPSHFNLGSIEWSYAKCSQPERTVSFSYRRPCLVSDIAPRQFRFSSLLLLLSTQEPKIYLRIFHSNSVVSLMKRSRFASIHHHRSNKSSYTYVPLGSQKLKHLV